MEWSSGKSTKSEMTDPKEISTYSDSDKKQMLLNLLLKLNNEVKQIIGNLGEYKTQASFYEVSNKLDNIISKLKESQYSSQTVNWLHKDINELYLKFNRSTVVFNTGLLHIGEQPIQTPMTFDEILQILEVLKKK